MFLAMPSLYEGFGLPVLEAMSFGVPVLTSSCSSLPEVAGDAGLLVDPYNIDSIADGLTKLITDVGLREQLAGRTKENVAKFGWEKTAREVMAAIEEAIAERQNRRQVG